MHKVPRRSGLQGLPASHGLHGRRRGDRPRQWEQQGRGLLHQGQVITTKWHHFGTLVYFQFRIEIDSPTGLLLRRRRRPDRRRRLGVGRRHPRHVQEEGEEGRRLGRQRRPRLCRGAQAHLGAWKVSCNKKGKIEKKRFTTALPFPGPTIRFSRRTNSNTTGQAGGARE